MELQFDASLIVEYAEKYNTDWDAPLEKLQPTVKARGHLLRSDLLEVDSWKLWTGRNRHRIKQNSADVVTELTGFALAAKTETARINNVLALVGVDIPYASTILHWFCDDDYPIWDYRALSAVGFNKKRYKNWFERWLAYTDFCRETAAKNQVKMRTLDRALWQSYEIRLATK